MIFSPNFQGRVSITFCSDVCRDKGPSYDHFAVVITKLDVSCCMRLGYSRACVFGCIYMCTLWLVCVNTAPFKKRNAPHFHSFYLRNELKNMLTTEFHEYETVNFLFQTVKSQITSFSFHCKCKILLQTHYHVAIQENTKTLYRACSVMTSFNLI